MVMRAKTKLLFQGRNLSERQNQNSKLNLEEIDSGLLQLNSYPRRLVLELTNLCNLNCVMCGRNAADFKPTIFDMDVFRSLEPVMNYAEEVTLMGWGEPTVHPRFVEMLETVHRHGARSYFCTNGMNLGALLDPIFENEVDVFAVSLDGATAETNDAIRRGASLDLITQNLREIVRIKDQNRLSFPWVNFVFCAMKSNLHELPDVVRLAADIGLEEVKVVYLTAFDDEMANQALWGCGKEIRSVFEESTALADSLGVQMKLPYCIGDDPAGEKAHKNCFVAWRDFFVGSDGWVRPCMSTAQQLFLYDKNRDFMDMWNDPSLQECRRIVNDENEMKDSCRRCYQSSFCNWNKRDSFIQVGNEFSPQW